MGLKETLIAEVDELIARRRKYEDKDFMTSEVLSWLSIISGALSPLVAIFKAPQAATATFGAIAGLLVAVEKVFKFNQRSSWNGGYKLALMALKYKIEDPDNNINQLAKDYIAIQEEWDAKYPGGNPDH